ncbi:MAG TPA: beta-L-arabinofuranosidase domain-containing protein [Longimicrobiales bacterium]|nr:beta-L-arabinofuranosidase domain-containing protein [Longimicrobiales bacterium]
MDPIDRRTFLTTAAAAGLAARHGAASAAGLDFGRALAALHDVPAFADYPVRAVRHDRVRITDAFWRPRIEANRNVSLDHCLTRFEQDSGFSVSKLIEAAAYMLTERPDAQLTARIEARIEPLLEGIERRIEDPSQAVRVSGHFLEAACAWFEATRRRRMLDIAIRAADAMDTVYGPGKDTYISGHEGLKIGLVALFRTTGDERYWRLAQFFADERGRDDYERTGEYAIDRTYAQDHAPVVEQTEAVGHCVRAMFLYIAMTDIAALTGDAAYTRAVDRLWQDVVTHKSYITGGIGSIRFHEQFGTAFELPNLSAWNETCAAYGSVVWNHRLFLLNCDARYIDVMERTLYNALLVGVSLSGDRFFYQNPLESFGDYERFEWINVPCCPPNVVRLVASLGDYIWATADSEVYANLFVDNTADIEVGGGQATLRQETRYPWDGAVRLIVEHAPDRPFALNVRIPGWTRGSVMPGDLYSFADGGATAFALSVNGQPVSPRIVNGYARIERDWRSGDVVELDIPMPVRRVYARSEVIDDRGRVALERGPLVYSAEWPDNNGRALSIVVPDDAALESEFRSDLLDGVQVIRGDVLAITEDSRGVTAPAEPHELVAIPYYAWANRGMGEMAVWMAREPGRAWLPPALPSDVASVRTSGGVEKAWTGYNDQNDDLAAIHDGREPINSADQSYRFFRMRPPVGSPAWIEYRFAAERRISSTSVYWFDDKRFCRLPDSWRVLYLADGEWVPVAAERPYEVMLDAWSTMRFEPVDTTAVRIEVEPRTVQYGAGEIGPPAAMFIDSDIDWRETGVIEWRVQ